jgi:hypothetical protein
VFCVQSGPGGKKKGGDGNDSDSGWSDGDDDPTPIPVKAPAPVVSNSALKPVVSIESVTEFGVKLINGLIGWLVG